MNQLRSAGAGQQIPVASQVAPQLPIPQAKAPQKLNTERISAPLPEKMFQPSINNAKDFESEAPDSDEESKYDELGDEMVCLILNLKPNLSFRDLQGRLVNPILGLLKCMEG